MNRVLIMHDNIHNHVIMNIIVNPILRLRKPEMRDDWSWGYVTGHDVKWFEPMMRMVEVAGDSFPEAILGESPLTCLIQYHHIHCSTVIKIKCFKSVHLCAQDCSMF